MVMMPPGAAASRGAQKAAMAGVIYDKETDKELGVLLEKLSLDHSGLDQWAAANIRDGKEFLPMHLMFSALALPD